ILGPTACAVFAAPKRIGSGEPPLENGQARAGRVRILLALTVWSDRIAERHGHWQKNGRELIGHDVEGDVHNLDELASDIPKGMQPKPRSVEAETGRIEPESGRVEAESGSIEPESRRVEAESGSISNNRRRLATRAPRVRRLRRPSAPLADDESNQEV